MGTVTLDEIRYVKLIKSLTVKIKECEVDAQKGNAYAAGAAMAYNAVLNQLTDPKTVRINRG